MSAPSASASSRAASGSHFMSRASAAAITQRSRVSFVHARQFHHAAIVTQGFADALVAIFVLHVHAAQVGWQTEMIGNEENDRLRIGRAEVVFQRGKLFLLCAAGVEGFQVADKDHLEGRHQRRRLGLVENVEDIGLGEIQIAERELAQSGVQQRVDDSTAAAFIEEDFVPDQHVTGAQTP